MNNYRKVRLRFLCTAVSLTLLTACGQQQSDNKTETAVTATMSAGEAVYKKNCKVCHAQGINGAPIVGNNAMWGPRVDKGEAALIENATNGFGLMPANSGRSGLSDDDIPLAVRYMLSQLE